MQQNPSQGIKEYVLDDVYTPGDANSRRERVPFDFVITEAQLQAWQGSSPIDIGDLILSNTDGSQGPALEPLIDHPISVYISADTTVSDAFSLYGSRLFVSGQVFTDVMLSKRGGATPLVHLYSKGPYAIDQVTGDWALHSTPESFVEIPAAVQGGASGVFYVGACKVKDGGKANTYGRPGYPDGGGLLIIYERCLDGEITWQEAEGGTRPTDSTTPGAVCAPWMSSDVDCEIQVDRSWTHVYGLSARIALALRLGGKPCIRVIDGGNFSLLRLVASTNGTFVFEGNSGTLRVSESNDNLLWGQAGGSTGGSRVVIRDTNISKGHCTAEGQVQLSFLESITSFIGDSVQIFRDGTTDFQSVAEDTGHSPSEAGSVDWYFAGSGGSVPSHLFQFKNANTLDWYTWCAISVHTTEGSGTSTVNHVGWLHNANSTLNLNASTLTEGVVYEIRLHVLELPSVPYQVETLTVGKQVMPNDTASTPPDCPNVTFAVHFYDSANNEVNVRNWGSGGSTAGWTTGCSFLCHEHSLLEGGHTPADPSRTLGELASGRMQFVKLGGQVYIMRY